MQERIPLILILILSAVCSIATVSTPLPTREGQGSGSSSSSRRSSKPRRQSDSRIHLLHADELFFDKAKNPDAQILRGHVRFRHDGVILTCDSACYYEDNNSFDAFGHVRMNQADTLTLTSRVLFYDGADQMARARYDVVLTHRKSKLYCDSLDYDRLYDLGYFFQGGKLVDQDNTLTSEWGQYSPATREAVFNYNVDLHNPDFTLLSDTLHYNTGTAIARIVGPSNIDNGDNHIYSERGYYDTKNDRARLLDRSVMTNQGKTLVGDSVWHDDKTGISKAYYNVVYTDTVNRNKLTCEYGEYNDVTGYAMCTDRAVSIDYSQRDSLFMHADTFKIYTFNINTDSVYRKIHAYNKVRAYRIDVQAVCDSLVYNSLDSCMTMYHDPIVWNGNQQLVGDEILVFMKDSVIDHAHVIDNGFSIEQLPDRENYNQISSKEMFAYFRNGEIDEAQAKDNVLIIYYPVDEADSSLIGLNYTETTELRMFMENRKMKKIWMPKAEGTLYPMSQIPPEKKQLPGYAWYDYIRPISRYDIFNWRGKRKETPKE